MKKLLFIIICLAFSKSILAQILNVSKFNESNVAMNALYYEGTKGIDYQFGPQITPHGDCIDVVNGYIFVTWYKGGLAERNLMLSRRKAYDTNASWVTIQFDHKIIGFQGNSTIGDSHNIASVGISTKDNTIHLLFDMHSYDKQNYPNDYFNYIVSDANAAFVPDSQFNASLFQPKRYYLKQGENYEDVTYPAFFRAPNGDLMTRWRVDGHNSGNFYFSKYNGYSWSDSILFSQGISSRGHYGTEEFLHGKLYLGFAVRWKSNSNYNANSGLYMAYANAPFGKNDWVNLKGNKIAFPIQNPDSVKIVAPSDDYGTATPTNTGIGPKWTVTESGAVHMITRVDNSRVHYYKPADSISTTNFSSDRW